MAPPELGCYSSHYAAWREFVISGCTITAVLEDDVHIDWDYLLFLLNLDWYKHDVQYLKLHAKIPASFRVIERGYPDRYHALIEFTDYSLGTQGYVITRSAAERFLSQLKTIRRPIDRALDRTWSHGVRSYAIFPSPMFESSIPSTIGSSRFAESRRGMTGEFLRISEKLKRLLFQIRF